MSGTNAGYPENGSVAAAPNRDAAPGSATGSVLVIGQEAVGGLAPSLCNGFRDLGWDVGYVKWGPWRPVLLSRLAIRNATLAEPFRYRLRRQVNAEARDRQFDLVVVVKGPFFDKETISAVRRMTTAPVVCWNPDSPFDDSMSNSGGGLTAAVPFYDGYVTWAEDVAERLRPHTRRVAVIPFGFDPHVHYREPGAGLAEDRLVFIATWTAERETCLRRLAKWEPIIFGNGWESCTDLDVRPPVFGSEFRGVVGEARWNLNLLRPQNRNSHNMRTFEIPACGGRQLAPMSPDHARYLSHRTAALFRNFDELTGHLETPWPDAGGDPVGGLEAHSYRSRVVALVDVFRREAW